MEPMRPGQSVSSYVAGGSTGSGGPLLEGSAVTDDERTLGMLAHLGTIAAVVFSAGFLGWAVPLFLLIAKGKQSGFVRQHAAESLNFQITVTLAAAALVFLTFATLLVGACVTVPAGLALAAAYLVLPLMAGLRAKEGQFFRYPFALRLVR